MLYDPISHRLVSSLAHIRLLAFALVVLQAGGLTYGAEAGDPWISPSALVLSSDGQTAYVASAPSGEVLSVNLATKQVVRRVALPGTPSGLVLSPDGTQLLATSASSQSQVCVIDISTWSVIRSIPVGHTALAPVLAADGATAYVCNRFNHSVSVIDLKQQKETGRISVEREPVAASLTRDGKVLLVANHLPSGRSDVGMVSAHVSVVDLSASKVIRQIVLPNGANLLRSVQVSPDGRFACVTHSLARFQLPTSQVERGWMNANAVTLIDTSNWNAFATVLLDNPEKGCANPWAAAWNQDGTVLVVTHAGSHEVSVIDFPGLLAKLAAVPDQTGQKAGRLGYVVAQVKAEVSQDLSFLGGLRTLVPLHGIGPRAMAVRNGKVCVGDYFSETLELIDLCQLRRDPVQVPLHPARPTSVARRGEAFFNDARLCLQTWQSCASCHSDDARADGLNWDLLNDGIGNPKNTKSLVTAHQTAPAMSMGVRDTAETAVRAGMHHILFMAPPEEVPVAVDEWLKSLAPMPSPYLVDGKLSPAAERGKAIFFSGETGCSACHNSDLFTDRRSYDVGTVSSTDRKSDVFDTPVLLELWRTAPYLHDGSAATLQDVLRDRNRTERHGHTSHLTETQVHDLVEYLLSL
jgi:YVTN family beta-propeller protein